jgi:hypothetical protein
MQDEHFMKLWSEAHGDFYATVQQAPQPAGSIKRPYEGSSSAGAVSANCRERLAHLLSWAIPGGILAGTIAAAIAAAAAMPVAPRMAGTYRPAVATFTLPYAA